MPVGFVVTYVVTRGGGHTFVWPPPLSPRRTKGRGDLLCPARLVRCALPLGNAHLHQVWCVCARVHAAPGSCVYTLPWQLVSVNGPLHRVFRTHTSPAQPAPLSCEEGGEEGPP